MAASSPAKSNSGTADNAAAAAISTPLTSSSSKSLRGLNKPKCIKCGNVARSRCPYQSCKNCCAKAQNPCHIHVLKGTSSLPDKPPTSSSTIIDQQTTEVSHSGNVHRLRQLSSNFAQFSNLQAQFRSRKPLSKKEALVINEWRFSKLKEFREGKIATETEAFDRYMQNVGLLEEVFRVNSPQNEQSSVVDSSSDGEKTEKMIQGMKIKLGLNPVRKENLRKRLQYIVDQGLKKLGKSDVRDDNDAHLSDTEGEERVAKKMKSSHGERVMALSDLNDKLNKARNEEDLNACWEMASQIFRWNGKENGLSNEQESRSLLPNKWVTPVTIEQEVLCRINEQFSSLEEIEDL